MNSFVTDGRALAPTKTELSMESCSKRTSTWLSLMPALRSCDTPLTPCCWRHCCRSILREPNHWASETHGKLRQIR